MISRMGFAEDLVTQEGWLAGRLEGWKVASIRLFSPLNNTNDQEEEEKTMMLKGTSSSSSEMELETSVRWSLIQNDKLVTRFPVSLSLLAWLQSPHAETRNRKLV